MDVEYRSADLWQDVFKPSCIKIGLHHVVGARRDAFAIDRQITGKAGTVHKVGTQDGDPVDLPAFGQRPGAVATHVGIADAGVAGKAAVVALAKDAGFDARDAGPLSNARYIEPLGYLNIQFGYMLGQGTQIAPFWLSR